VIASEDTGTASPAATRPQLRMAHFALDVPHKGQASYVHIREIIENLRRLGWQVDAFAPAPAAIGSPRPAGWRAIIYTALILRTMFCLPRYQVIYVRAHPFAWPVTFAARLLRRVVVQEVNGIDLDVVIEHPWLNPLRGVVQWLYRSQYRASDLLFPVTERLGDWLRGIAGHTRVKVVQNGANPDFFKPVERKCDPFVVFVGGLTAWHGIDLMIDTLRHPRWPKNVELVLIGDGNRAHLVGEAAKSGLPVRWLGYRPHEEVPRLMAGAIAGLIPITNPRGRSSTGTAPLKLFETLACGIPAIVTDLPGQADIVREADCGIVVPCDDPGALADAVALLSADPATRQRMGQRGTELVRTRHTWAARAADIDRALRDVVN
jgi:glycosyltransferase involved in cell wall biosynthesis